MGKNLLFRYTKPTKMKGFQEKTAYLTENACYVSSVSPVILWKKIGQPATNCDRRFFNGFRLCNVSLLTYQKSQKIPLREVTKKRDLL